MREARVKELVDLLMERYPALDEAKKDIVDAYCVIADCYRCGGKLLIAGNGGSAADAEHMVGELMKSFALERKIDPGFSEQLISTDLELGDFLAKKLQGALPAIALGSHSALAPAIINDCEPQMCFAQQVHGYGREGDVFFGISTSGNSKNILYAATVARTKGMKVVALTGEEDSKLSALADVCIKAPGKETHVVQELHLPIYHCLCLMLEETFFGE